MQLSGEFSRAITVGQETATFTLQTPTPEELNTFLAARYETSRKGRLRDNSIAARVAFFDLLLIRVENLEDSSGGAIGPDRCRLIPANWKNTIIFYEFEDIEIDEKN